MGYSRACKEKSTTTLPRVISLAGSAAIPGQPAAHASPDGLTRAYAACERLAREHYENFPVASRLLPRRMRPHVAAVYAFARHADDFADEARYEGQDRLALLDAWLERLRACPSRDDDHPIFLALEWADAMEAGNFRSQREFARAIGLSHGRVSQVLGLLRLCSDVLEALDALGDPLYSWKVTERKLRPFTNLPKLEQKLRLEELLR